MIYWRLFLTFLEIGAVSFGGGYGMISLIREKVLAYGWLTEEEFLSFIAVSESTPGPLAVNMATFIGSSQAGLMGALVSALSTLFAFSGMGNAFAPDFRALGILGILLAVHAVWYVRRHRAPSPILMILIAAGLGILLYANG